MTYSNINILPHVDTIVNSTVKPTSAYDVMRRIHNTTKKSNDQVNIDNMYDMTYVDIGSREYANSISPKNDYDSHHDDQIDEDPLADWTDRNRYAVDYEEIYDDYSRSNETNVLMGGKKKPTRKKPSTSGKSTGNKRKQPSTDRKPTGNKRKQPVPNLKPTITSMHSFLQNMYIYIRYNKDLLDKSSIPLLGTGTRSKRIALTINQYVVMFLRHLNFVIAVKTNVNYNLIDSKQLYIKLPIYVYTNDEAAMHPLDLILHRVETLRKFIESYDFSKDTKSVLWLIRTLTALGVSLNSDFNITVDCSDFNYVKVDEPLQFTYPPIEHPTIKRHSLKDNSTITVYEDPYFNDYGVFVNLSVTFDEMGLSYNGLHLYEHLMTKGWVNLSVNDQIYANGVTYPTGICMVFNILSTENAYREYASAAFEWLFKCRDENFWTTAASDEILMETCRTISETRTERTLASMGRSDFHAYGNNYDRSIFEYWSNKPFTVLLTVPKGTKSLDIEGLNNMVDKHPLRNIPRPPDIKIPYYPFEVMNSKSFMKTYTLKTDIEHIKAAIMKPKLKTKVYFGVDCYMGQDETAEGNDLSEYNSVLHPLLFLNQYFTEEELNKFSKTHITAASSEIMPQQSLCIRHGADVLNECKLII